VTLKNVLYLIRFGLTPEQAAALPLEVEAWLMPTEQAIHMIENEARGR
jgi:hypothetical protein